MPRHGVCQGAGAMKQPYLLLATIALVAAATPMSAQPKCHGADCVVSQVTSHRVCPGPRCAVVQPTPRTTGGDNNAVATTLPRAFIYDLSMARVRTGDIVEFTPMDVTWKLT